MATVTKRHGVALMLAALVLPGMVMALPAPRETVPSFEAKDLLGKSHDTREWQGRRVLVVMITDQHAGDEMRRWFDAADGQMSEQVHRASIISLGLPFYVSAGMARGKAQQQVPRAFWSDTWMDKDAKMAKRLGLATSREPYVLALDEKGQVLASVHGTVDSPDAPSIWKALSSRTP